MSSGIAGEEAQAKMDDGDLNTVETNVIDSTEGADCLQLSLSESTPPQNQTDSLKSPSLPNLNPVKEEPEPDFQDDSQHTAKDESNTPREDPPSSSSPPKDPVPAPRPSPPLSPPSPPPRSITMPKLPTLTNLPDLALHSPNSQIVGTPFTTTSNNKFEYPFPDSSSSSPDSTPSAYAGPSFSSSFPTIIPQSTQLSSSPPSLSNFPTTFPPQSEISNYTPAHPKMRQPNPPPVPPTLVKKRHRWSLGLLGRRRSSYGSQTSDGSVGSGVSTSTNGTVPAVEGVSVIEQAQKNLARSGSTPTPKAS